MSKPIEVVLKSFVRHVVDLQHEDDPAGTGFHREFRILREMQIESSNEGRFPLSEGKKEENIRKNRYKDIVPRDDRRVKLKEIPGEAGSDYINASFIDDVDGKWGYIAAQGPMPHTVIDFWRMLWEYKVEIVFMACRTVEDRKAKCEKYWPEPGESIMFGNVKVQTESEETVQEHFIKRRLRAEKKSVVHRFIQFQYVGWPDHNIPSSPDVLRRMIEEVRNHRKRLNVPMVVHCSAGCGRTGTICAIDFAWTLLDRGMVTEGFSMFEVIRVLREQRLSMVQTPDQYEYTHMVMKSLCNEWLATFAKNDYENVNLGGGKSDEAQEPEESYYNVDFHQDQSNSRGSAISSRPPPKESTAAPSSSRASMKSQRPQITRQRPEVTGQKPDISKQKPIGWIKPNAAASATTSTTTATTTATSSSSFNPPGTRHSGDHVTTQQAPPPQCSSSHPPPLTDKQSPRHLDPNNLFLQADAAQASKIGKSGTAGRSAMRLKSRSAVAQGGLTDEQSGIKGHQGGGWGGGGKEEAGGMEDDPNVYMAVNKKNPKANAPYYENHQLYENEAFGQRNNGLLTDGNCSNEMFVDESPQYEPPPALPARQYRPEEIAQISKNATAGKPSDTAAGHPPQPRHQYDNVQAPFTSQPTTPPSFPKGNVHRTQQPIPLTPPSASPHSGGQHSPGRRGRVVSPRTARRQGQAVADSSSSPAMGGQSPSAIGVPTKPSYVQPRPGWMESGSSQHPAAPAAANKRDFPGAYNTGAGGYLSHATEETSRSHAGEGQKHIVAAPGPGQTIQARSGKSVCELVDVLERSVPRVRGPRPPPLEWKNKSRNQRGQFF
ncbi:uncharacterized protein LOC143284643 isoform X2 [Babylonia areolata]|uniref:uncharacterized protein LOC143284643 isoform X2 n=1 Tax=Babylonia areolata TaxID=304850 RepID=UPI003FD4A580